MASAVSAVLCQISLLSLVHCSSALTLAVEDVAAHALAHGHAQVDIEADTGDADASIVFVLGQQEGVVVVVVVVRVAGMPAALCLGRHSSGNVSCAMRDRAPIKWAR